MGLYTAPLRDQQLDKGAGTSGGHLNQLERALLKKKAKNSLHSPYSLTDCVGVPSDLRIGLN